MSLGWPVGALLSAAFAALTAIFAKIGVEGVNSDCATVVRSLVVIAAFALIRTATGQWQSPGTVSGRIRLLRSRASPPAPPGSAASAP